MTMGTTGQSAKSSAGLLPKTHIHDREEGDMQKLPPGAALMAPIQQETTVRCGWKPDGASSRLAPTPPRVAPPGEKICPFTYMPVHTPRPPAH